MEKKREEKRKKKGLVAFLFLFASFILVSGSLFAFFSDQLTGTGSATAGTLDIGGAFKTYYDTNSDGTLDEVASVTNFNPGDMMVIKGEITNFGNKSAWLRTKVDLSAIDSAILPYIKVCAGELTAADQSTCTALTNGGTSTPIILNGQGTGAETETASGAVGDYKEDVAVTIYFDASALNAAQGKTVDVSFDVEAMQYRNNATPTWTNLETITTYEV